MTASSGTEKDIPFSNENLSNGEDLMGIVREALVQLEGRNGINGMESPLYEELRQISRRMNTSLKTLKFYGISRDPSRRPDVDTSAGTDGSESEPSLSNNHDGDLFQNASAGHVQPLIQYSHKVIEHHTLMGQHLDDLDTEVNSNFPTREMLNMHLAEARFLVDQNKQILIDLLSELTIQDLVDQQLGQMEKMMYEVRSRMLKIIVMLALKIRREGVQDDPQEALFQKEGNSPSGMEHAAHSHLKGVLKEFGF